MPKSEGHVRPLLALPKDERVSCWKEIVADTPPAELTGRQVTKLTKLTKLAKQRAGEGGDGGDGLKEKPAQPRNPPNPGEPVPWPRSGGWSSRSRTSAVVAAADSSGLVRQKRHSVVFEQLPRVAVSRVRQLLAIIESG